MNLREIIIKTQDDLDALPNAFEEYTTIKICATEIITIRETRDNSHVEALGNSRVEALGNSRVEASGNSRVVARDNSHVEAWEDSHVEARDNSRVVALGNSHVVAWHNSHVEARDNSLVVAWDNSHVVALGNAKCIRQSDIDGTVESVLRQIGPENGQEIVVYKRVSTDFKTQEGTENETLWAVGTDLEHPAWDVSEECGDGKFHACFTPRWCDGFRDIEGDRYVAILVQTHDLHVFARPTYPQKLAFRRGKVLFECNIKGEKL